MNYRLLLSTLSTALVCLLSSNDALAAKSRNTKVVDFNDPAQSVDAFIRMRADSSGKDSVTWWYGSMFVVLPNEAPKRVFGFEGFNVARMEKQADGSTRMLTREYAIYRDPKTNAILKSWENPYTNKTVAVFDVQNDPVNQTFGRKNAEGKVFPMPFKVLGPDIQLGFDVPLSYPNPIDPKKYPMSANHPMYTGSEHFGFFAKKADFDNHRMTSVPVGISWSRTSPWMPWMQMGDKPGYVMFTAWGKKLGGIAEISADFLEHVKSTQPKFLTAPKDFVEPNATTWTVYKALVLEKEDEAKK
jgi:Protein of unknown function (DUF1838)